MTSTFMKKALGALVASGLMVTASANSIGYTGSFTAGGGLTINVTYDFSEFAMFGGGLDLYYDPNAIEFVSYTQAALPADAQAAASPAGVLVGPGLYEGFGIGTFEFFNGMTSVGDMGSFVFNILGGTDPSATPCGTTICIVGNPVNPFVSLAGEDVTAVLLGDGISIGITADGFAHVPVPAAVWLMLSGLAALVGLGRHRV
ncbi:MAG: VPLPA-CTERM sorting domain-containing protein [Pseudomonadota bacterium]